MDVYLLGAGFSSDAGVPTMKNFLAALSRLTAGKPPGEEKKIFENTLDFARRENETHIEKLLVKALNKPVFDDVVWAFALTVNEMSAAFCRSQASQSGWYKTFARILCTGSSRVLTFNYDLILEEMLTRHTVCGYDYGLRFDVRDYFGKTGGGVIPLYKLHGSVSFLRCAKCGYFMDSGRHAVNLRLWPCPRCGRKLAPLLVPPTFHKPSELGDHVLQELWKKADTLFMTGTRFIVGGLSFNTPDTDIKNRLIKGLQANSGIREIVLINHNPDLCIKLADELPPGINIRMYPGFAEFAAAKAPV